MKLEANNKLMNSDSPGDQSEEQPNENRHNAEDLLEEILDEMTESRSLVNSLSFGGNGTPNGMAETSTLLDLLTQPIPRSPFILPVTDNGIIDGIDPQSDLGMSVRNKFLELEEISQRLKTRLNQVVLDENIVLSPDADVNSLEAELERDLDTDCHEDLSLQEFLELVKSQSVSSAN